MKTCSGISGCLLLQVKNLLPVVESEPQNMPLYKDTRHKNCKGVCVYFVPEQYENNQKTRGNKSTDKRYILVPWQHRPVGVSLFVCILVKVFACITVKEKHVDKSGCLRQKHFFLTQKTHYCVIFLKLKPLCDQNTKGRGYVALPLCVYPPGARFTSLSLFSCFFCSFSSSSLLCWASHSCFILACRHGKRLHTLFQ